jgi:uncharacterized membrane protein YkoI
MVQRASPTRRSSLWAGFRWVPTRQIGPVQVRFTAKPLSEAWQERVMIVQRVSAAALLALAVSIVPARAEEVARPAHAEATHVCLNQKERRSLVDSGAVMRLAAAMRGVRGHVAGTLIRARLCHRGDGFVYVLTVLAHDGKVIRVVVDAVKGTLVGER